MAHHKLPYARVLPAVALGVGGEAQLAAGPQTDLDLADRTVLEEGVELLAEGTHVVIVHLTGGGGRGGGGRCQRNERQEENKV